MDCSEFEEVLHDLDRPGTPGLALREVALAHAECCSSCAQLMTDVESLDFSLQTIATRDAHLQAPPRIEANLLREFGLQKAAASRQKMRGRLAALGAAAAILLALGLSLRHGSASGKRAASETRANQVTAPNPTAPVEVAENRLSDSQDDTGFVSLPYAADPATLEDGAVVRVVLSRSALASLGFPVADVGRTEQVPADIVLSEDGAPQAIRLVSQASLEQ
ncbi:MAG: hypothetical protein ABSA57_02470 [Candidatus Acidiferrales bacterium]|jgi:hypothetical protein